MQAWAFETSAAGNDGRLRRFEAGFQARFFYLVKYVSEFCAGPVWSGIQWYVAAAGEVELVVARRRFHRVSIDDEPNTWLFELWLTRHEPPRVNNMSRYDSRTDFAIVFP